jgi:hypothetical protein
MEQIHASTLDELREQVGGLITKFGRHDFAGNSVKNQVVFRGHADAVWELESTLERASSRDWTLRDYLDLSARIRPFIETYYPLPFSTPTRDEVYEWLKNIAYQHGVINVPSFDYLLYLRHHGFPSPFVDWTASLYVALGFAFFRESAAGSRAIFMFIDTISGLKGGSVGEPQIELIGPYVKTDKRHFLQQARYTICFNRENADIPLEKYSKAVSVPQESDQDLLWKFVIPSSERESILQFLASVNINPFSLMPSEENLMETLWLNESTLPEFERMRYEKTEI